MQRTHTPPSGHLQAAYCINTPSVAPIGDNAVSTVWSREAGMSATDGSRWLDDAGLSVKAQQRNQDLIAEVRALLAQGDAAGFGALLGDFSDLLDAGGPLAYVRFDPELFSHGITQLLSDAPLEAPEAACDFMHETLIDSLATDVFICKFRLELQRFMALPFVPNTDRLCACAALLTTRVAPHTHRLTRRDLPALYAVFRAQLVDWLLQAGVEQRELADMAAALS